MTRVLVLAVSVCTLCGCSAKNSTFQSDDHAHERDKMMLEDAGPYHAALTAHLSSKGGHELDIFFETTDNPPKPAPLPLTSFIVFVGPEGGTAQAVLFEPAPKEERKDDPEGKCSHFVGKIPWLKPEESVTVTTTVDIDGTPTTITWKDFHSRKFAHHED
ncbi:MAG: hypothetical protein L0241_09025 [Planctomycetia bacterium]|nr:hypothetical protein [Planctomycetia bacterium]